MNSNNTNSQINLDSLANTNTYFNNFYQPQTTVSQNIDDAILAYFEEITDTPESARALASAVILTSATQKINPIDTIKQFKSMPANQLNAYLTMFLNLNRIGTSYLGINNAPKTSKYVARLIKA